jgi:hypothetical protein
MTPQEKANELLDELIKPIIHLHQYPLCFEASKECAIITVDEILNVLYSLKFGNAISEEIEYWDKVKYEIENI